MFQSADHNAVIRREAPRLRVWLDVCLLRFVKEFQFVAQIRECRTVSAPWNPGDDKALVCGQIAAGFWAR
jgi:hypothetical protein